MKKSTSVLTISSFLAKYKGEKAETYSLFKIQTMPSCQKQPEKASQMVTYILFKIKSNAISATSRKGQPDNDLHTVRNQRVSLSATSREGQPDADADLHTIQNQKHDFVSNEQGRPARC